MPRTQITREQMLVARLAAMSTEDLTNVRNTASAIITERKRHGRNPAPTAPKKAGGKKKAAKAPPAAPAPSLDKPGTDR